MRRMHIILRVRFAPGPGPVPHADCATDEENGNDNDVRRLSNRNWRRLRCAMRAERPERQSKCARIAAAFGAYCSPVTCYMPHVPHTPRERYATSLLASTAKAEANTKHTRGVGQRLQSVSLNPPQTLLAALFVAQTLCGHSCSNSWTAVAPSPCWPCLCFGYVFSFFAAVSDSLSFPLHFPAAAAPAAAVPGRRGGG